MSNIAYGRALRVAVVLLVCCGWPARGRGELPAHDAGSLQALKSLSGQTTLSADDLTALRKAMLTINNEARINPEYRRLNGNKNDAQLPSGLAPLVIDDFLNTAAQAQAEGLAGIRQLGRDQQAPGLMASGASTDLADFPIGWQTSEQTYRPTWNLGGHPVDSVGYGAARNARNGEWSVVAIWADRAGAAVKDSGLHTPALIKQLSTLSDQTTLDAAQLQTLRETMLKLNNEARANPEYRKKVGAKKDLNLPSDLKPLVLDDAANKAAQEQADYQAANGTMTHDNRNYRDFSARLDAVGATGGLEACGVSPSLTDFPMGWMKSETHYRPTWNIVDPVDRVGYGVAKNARDGKWYATAVWRQVDKNAKPETAEAVAPAKPDAGAATPTAAADPTHPAGMKLLATQGDYPKDRAKDADFARLPVPAGLMTVDGKEPVGVSLNAKAAQTGDTDMFARPYASLRKGGVLYKGQAMWADDFEHKLFITDDGAVAIKDKAGNVTWSAGKGGTHVEYQGNDGNFCLYDDAKQWKWGSQTFGPTLINGQVRVNAEGVLEQLDENGKRAWSSK